MKTITQHITERLQLNKNRIKKHEYIYSAETTRELVDIITSIINKHKTDNIINLNIIDTSKIEDMSNLFEKNNFFFTF